MVTGDRYSVGLDIGGTFTDIVIADSQTGEIKAEKYLTTFQDPSEGVIAGLKRFDGAPPRPDASGRHARGH